MRPRPGEVLHFSEDPTITLFRPHVALTARQPEPYVWAVDHDRAPDYWFPRQCPRVLAWIGPATTAADRVPADRFRPFGGHARVAEEPVEPLGPPLPVGDLLACHAAAGIQLRVLDNLWPFWAAVTASTLAFSGIRLR